MKPDLNDQLWYGSQASYEAALELEASMQARGPFDGEIDPNYLLSKQHGIGIVAIKGPLLNTDNPLAALFGIATYPAIRAALVAAAQDKEIKSILLHVDSGGGSVSGVADTADLISRVAQVKPVTAFAEGLMASAAYWLGVSAPQRFASKTAIVGSIGVLTVHVDRSEQLKQDGIKATVIRSGKYKALGHPLEPLSDTAKEHIQAQVDAAYKVFGDHVAAALGMSFEAMDKKVGQGRDFFGQQAVDVGLVDGLASFDALVSKLAGTKGVDKRSAKYDNGIKGAEMTKKHALTDQDIAALAEGAEAALASKPEEKTAEQLAAEAAATAAAEAAAAAAATAAAEAAAAAAAKPDEKKEESDLVAFLRAELKSKDDAILAAGIARKDLETKLVTVEATHEGLLVIARTSIGNMRVALGGSAAGVDSLGAVEVLAEHKTLSASFKDKFKVGGVAAVTAEPEKDPQGKGAAPALHAARVAAARVTAK